MSAKETKQVDRAWPVIRVYAKALGKYPGLLTAVLIGSLTLEVAAIGAPLYLRELIDFLAAHPQPQTAVIGSALGILALYGLIAFIRTMGSNVQGVASSYLDARVMSDLSNSAFRNLLGHSHDFFISNFAGALTRRVSRYASAFEQIFDTLVFNIFSTVVFAIGAIAVLLNRSVVLGTVLLIWTILFLLLQIALTKWKQPIRVARAAADTRVTGVLSDAISNQSTISQFAASRYERKIFGETMEYWRKATLRAWISDAWVSGIQGIFVVIIQVALLGGAVVLWQRGEVSVGDFVLIQIYILGLIDRIWNMGNSMRRLYEAFADAHEMVAIIEKPYGVRDLPDAMPLKVTEGRIDMGHVSFGFGEKDVLKDFTLAIAAGEKVALVGPSGAGKSTVTKLLLRLYDVTAGSISIDGQDIARVTQESLREAIAFVPQEPILFHRSLMDNIRYGRRDATDEEVYEAARQARCHDFIAALSDGYETHVGERGVKLSGGERQRVAIARAILKNAPILILDEATSSLDSESESLIQEALEVLMKGKTVVVIAHRLSTIMHMDRIIVMEQGRIVAGGTHDELLDHKGGLYHKLWSIQAGSFIADTTPT